LISLHHLVVWLPLILVAGFVPAFSRRRIQMNQKFLNCLAACALATALSLASPALGRGGFGGGMGGGMHGGAMGGMGGGMHGGTFSGMARGMPVGAIGAGMRFAPQFNGGRFANPRFAHAAISPHFSSFAFNRGFHRHFFHHRFNRFAFVGLPFAYATYDSCWSQIWTPYGPQLVDVCTGYGY
jgi:hypothetical protein